MPITEEMKKYEGQNPRTNSFDTFWDNSQKEMRTVDPCVELVPNSFEVPFAECFDLYYNGVSCARIHAKYLRPKNYSVPHPAILRFHGYTQNSDF